MSEADAHPQGDVISFTVVFGSKFLVGMKRDERLARCRECNGWSEREQPCAVAVDDARALIVADLLVGIAAQTDGQWTEMLA